MNSLKDEIKYKIWDQVFEDCREALPWNKMYRRDGGFIDNLRSIKDQTLTKVWAQVNEIS
jgi:hypothetical protein